VTGAKVNHTGALSGQALMFDGTNVVWGNPTSGPVALPYEGTISSSGFAFSITNTGDGGAGFFQVDNATNDQPALHARSNGTGEAGYFEGDVTVTGVISASSFTGSGASLTGVNADRVDGKHASEFALSTHDHDATYVNEGQINSITTSMLQDNAVTTGKILDGAVTDAKITGPISGSKLGSHVHSATDITSGTLSDSVLSTNVLLLNNAQTITGLKSFNPSSGSVPFSVGGTKTGLVTNLNADMLDGKHASEFWSLTGNSGTNPASNFIGTTDGQALEFRVNNARAFRIEPHATSPNVIGGFSGNTVTSGVYGAVIGGGGASGGGNRVTDNYGTVGGGENNQAGDNAGTTSDSGYATVGGGQNNTASGDSSTVGGGYTNTASGYSSTVGGGYTNTASGNSSAVGGGAVNNASGIYAAVGGGYTNTASSDYSTVRGGAFNNASGIYAAVGGGYNNTASATGPPWGVDTTTRPAATTLPWGVDIPTRPAAPGLPWEVDSPTRPAAPIPPWGGDPQHGQRLLLHRGGGFITRPAATTPPSQADIVARPHSMARWPMPAAGFRSMGTPKPRPMSFEGRRRATPTPLYLDGSSERLTVGNNRTMTFDILVVGRSSGGDSAGYHVRGVIENSGGTTSFVGTPTVTTLGEDTASWNVAVEADDTNDALVIRVTGEAGKPFAGSQRFEPWKSDIRLRSSRNRKSVLPETLR
jgi:hypothetical protein